MNRDDGGRIHFKLVLWGPYRSGKTTMIRWFYNNAEELGKGGFTSVENNLGETVYFDYASLSTGGGVVYDFFAVGGSDNCSKERRILVQGADALIFVAHSSASKLDNNMASLEELTNAMGDSYGAIPMIFMLNKRDEDTHLIDSAGFSELPNVRGHKVFESVSGTGDGISDAFQNLMVDLVETTLTLQEIPQAPPELIRMGVALISAAQGFDPTLEGTYPHSFSITPNESGVIVDMHPLLEDTNSFATVRTENFYLCSYHIAKRDSLGASSIVSLAMPIDTPAKRIASLFRRIQDSAPVILGQKDVTSTESLNQALEQFYILARDHIVSTMKSRSEDLVLNPKDVFKDKLFIGGAEENIGKGSGYLRLLQLKDRYEFIYAPKKANATYTAIIPLEDYGLKTMIKEVDRLRSNFETRKSTASTQALRNKFALNFLDEVKKVSNSILNTMLNRDILSMINDDDPDYLVLEVDRETLMIPLEILYDGTEFLCMKKPVSRWVTPEYGALVLEEKEKPVPRVRNKDEPLSILLIESRIEGETALPPEEYGKVLEKSLREDLSSPELPLRIEVLRGVLPKQEVLSHLSSASYDIVHFIGPAAVSSGDPTASSWLFHDGEIRGYELGKFLKNGYPQLIISYVRSPSWDRKWDGKTQDRILHTLAHSTKLAGPECFIGTVTEGITDSMLILTLAFYLESLKNKKAIGEALRDARLWLVRERGMQDDTWMKPVLYGNPTKVIS